MTTLSQQLKRLAVPQTQIYRPGIKRASFLFEPNEAAGLDKETVFALGSTGFDELQMIDESFSQFAKTLFNDSSVGVQRAVLSREANETLNSTIEKFLLHLTPYFPLKAAHKALEWLIYRFNIHQYNVDDLMRCILPYHDTNLFVRMVQILEISEKNSLWYWLVPIRKPGVPLTRRMILNHCSTNLGFVSFICDMINRTINVLNEKELKSVQILFTFYTSIICGTISSLDSLTEPFVAQLIPNVISGLKSNITEYVMASYMIICQLSLKINIKTEISKILAKEILLKLKPDTTLQGLSTVIVLFQSQLIQDMHPKTIAKFASKEEKLSVIESLQYLNEKTNVEQFLIISIKNMVDIILDKKLEPNKLSTIKKFLKKFVRDITFEPTVAQSALQHFVDKFLSQAAQSESDVEQFQTDLGEICALLFRRYPAVFDAVIEEKYDQNENELKKFVAICDAGVHMPMDTAGSLMLSLNHANQRIRCMALMKLFDYIENNTIKVTKLDWTPLLISNEEKKEISTLLLERFSDDDVDVLKVLVENLEVIVNLSGGDETIAKLCELLDRPEPERHARRWKEFVSLLIENMSNLKMNENSESSKNVLSHLISKLFVFRKNDFVTAKIIANSHLVKIFGLKKYLTVYAKNLNKDQFDDINNILIEQLVAWICENFDERITIIQNIYSNDWSFKSMFVSYIYMEIQKNLSSATDRRSSFLIEKLEGFLDLYQITDEIIGEIDNDGVKLLRLYASGKCIPRQFAVLVAAVILRYYWNRKNDSFYDLVWWPIDDSNPVVRYLLTYFELILDGIASKSKSKKFFLTTFQSFLKTYFVNLTDSFKMATICLLSERWRYIILAVLNLTLTMIKETKKENLERFLSEDSIVPIVLIIGMSSEFSNVRSIFCQCTKAIVDRLHNSSAFYFDLFHFITKQLEEIETDENHLAKLLGNFSNAKVEILTPKKRKKSLNLNDNQLLLRLFGKFFKLTDVASLNVSVCGLNAFRFVNSEEILAVCADGLDHLFKSNLNFDVENRTIWEKFIALSFDKYSSSNAGCLNLNETPYVLLKKVLSSEFENENATNCALNRITFDFFESLDVNVKEDLFETLLCLFLNCLSEKSSTIGVKTKNTLANIPITASFLASFLEDKIYSSNDVNSLSPKKAKRRRTESETVLLELNKMTPIKLKSLTFVLEIFLSNENAERGEILMKPFFNAVRIFLDVEDETKTEYGLQLALHALELICKGKEGSRISPASFDVELLVRCIRTAETSMTHQHAFQLLTVAATLFKEDLIVRLMPIFSFMGKNLFRQDDIYSFQIIHRTVDTIIPSLIATSDESKLDEILLKIFRDFALSAVHIPEHRRLNVLTKLVQASKLRNSSENESASTIRCNYLWMLVGLLLEYHVSHWKKDEPNDEQRLEIKNIAADSSPLHPNIEFCLRLCDEFSPVDQIFCATRLLKYVANLPDELTPFALAKKPTMPAVFDMKNSNDKRLRHFKHEILGFIGYFLGSRNFALKLADFKDDNFQELAPICEGLVIEIVQYVKYCQRLADLKSNDILGKYWKAMLVRSKNCLDKVNALLPADMALNILNLLLRRESNEIKEYALEILNGKLLQNPTPFTSYHAPKLCAIAQNLNDWLTISSKNHEEIILGQCALFSLKLLTRVAGGYDSEPFLETFRRTVAILHNWKNSNKLLLSNAILCLADLVSGLGVHTMPLLPTFMQDLLDILRDERLIAENELLFVSCFLVLQKIVESLAHFLNPYLSDILRTVAMKAAVELNNVQYKNQLQHRLSLIKKNLAALPTRVLLPAVQQAVDLNENESRDHWAFIFGMLSDHLNQASSENVTKHSSNFINLFTNVLDLRWNASGVDEADNLEDSVLNAFSQFALKLSENDFRPLMVELIHWATNDEDKKERLITLFRLSNKLADKLRSLFTLFAGHLIRLTSELIVDFNPSKKEVNKPFSGKNGLRKTNILLCDMFDLVSKCSQYDTNNFMNRERFDLLMQPLVDQIDNISVKHYQNRIEKHLSPCVVNLATSLKDDSAWKVLNYEILLKTRHRKSKVRMAALQIVENLYSKLGEDLSTLIPESVPFLVELMEDESEEVERQCQKVVGVLETIVGESLKDYF